MFRATCAHQIGTGVCQITPGSGPSQHSIVSMVRCGRTEALQWRTLACGGRAQACAPAVRAPERQQQRAPTPRADTAAPLPRSHPQGRKGFKSFVKAKRPGEGSDEDPEEQPPAQEQEQAPKAPAAAKAPAAKAAQAAKAAPAAPAAAPPPPPAADDDGSGEGSDGEGGPETRGKMLQRHKKVRRAHARARRLSSCNAAAAHWMCHSMIGSLITVTNSHHAHPRDHHRRC